jgi:hypothetical protein
MPVFPCGLLGLRTQPGGHRTSEKQLISLAFSPLLMDVVIVVIPAPAGIRAAQNLLKTLYSRRRGNDNIEFWGPLCLIIHIEIIFFLLNKKNRF